MHYPIMTIAEMELGNSSLQFHLFWSKSNILYQQETVQYGVFKTDDLLGRKI